MPDWSLPNCITLVCGQGSCGKTTFALRYLLNVPAACRFIFDDRGQAASRLKLKHCGTARECELAVPTRWVCFNPHVMFEGHQLKEAFRWFCKWSFDVSKRGPGKKVLFVDELWQWCDAKSIPVELQNIVITGRVEGLQLLSCTQRPRHFHVDIRAQVTECVLFNMAEPEEIKTLKAYYASAHKAASLPRGQFLGYNRESGAELLGRVF